MVSDAGGQDATSEAVKSLAKRATTIVLQLEHMEAKFAASAYDAQPSSLDTYQRLTNTLRRVYESIGLKRQPRDITPTVDEYLRLQEQHDEDAAQKKIKTSIRTALNDPALLGHALKGDSWKAGVCF